TGWGAGGAAGWGGGGGDGPGTGTGWRSGGGGGRGAAGAAPERGKRPPAGPPATAVNPGQPSPPPQSAATRPSITMAGPSPARSRYTAWKSRSDSRPRPSSTYRARSTRPDPRAPQATGFPLRSAIGRTRASPRPTNSPPVEYIAARPPAAEGGRPTPLSASGATSPWTSAMSTWPASSSGTFSVLPFVFLVWMSSDGSA